MAGSFIGTLRDSLLNLVFGQTSYTPPTSVIFSLTTTSPSEGAAGTEVSTSGTAYARLTKTNNKTTWSTSSAGAGTLSNAIALEWVKATASWGTVVGGNIYDQGGTTRIGWFTLATSKAIDANDKLVIEIGDMDITLAAS